MATLGCLLLSGIAVLLFFSGPPQSAVRRRLTAPATVEHPGRRRRWLLVAGVVVGSVGVVAGGVVLGGPPGAVVALSMIMVGLTVGRMIGHGRDRRRAARRQLAVARACAALAAQLRVGQIPAEALATAAVDHPVLEPGQRCVAVGGDLLALWRSAARAPGAAGLLELARAWQVSALTGAPMAETLEQVAAAQASDQSLRSMIDGELAAPRATSKIMAVLPACGIGLGYVLGGQPLDWLLSGPLGWGCLLGGVLLACLGMLWIAALARQVAT